MNTQQRFTGKDDIALPHGIDIAPKLEPFQKIEEGFFKQIEAFQIGDIFIGKAQVLQEVEQVIQACEDGKPAVEGLVAVEHIENDLGIVVMQVVSLHHGQLIKVGQHSRRRHQITSLLLRRITPSPRIESRAESTLDSGKFTPLQASMTTEVLNPHLTASRAE